MLGKQADSRSGGGQGIVRHTLVLRGGENARFRRKIERPRKTGRSKINSREGVSVLRFYRLGNGRLLSSNSPPWSGTSWPQQANLRLYLICILLWLFVFVQFRKGWNIECFYSPLRIIGGLLWSVHQTIFQRKFLAEPLFLQSMRGAK